MESLGTILASMIPPEDGLSRSALPSGEGNLDNLPHDPVCADCNGAGWLVMRSNLSPNDDPDFGKLVMCPTCGPVKQQASRAKRMERLSRECGLSEDQRMLTFENFTVYAGNKSARDAARKFAHAPLKEWLLISSPTTGNGKTHLLCAIANAILAQGIPVLYTHIVHLLDYLRAGYNPHRYGPGDDIDDEQGQFEARWQRVLDVDVLLIDDLGVQVDREWVVERLETLVNYRCDHRLATAITTNLTEQRIRDFSDRVYDRIMRYPATVVANSAEKYRLHAVSGQPVPR